jgi:hypothetical protein
VTPVHAPVRVVHLVALPNSACKETSNEPQSQNSASSRLRARHGRLCAVREHSHQARDRRLPGNRTPDNLFQGLCTANNSVPGCSATGIRGTYNIVSTYVNAEGQTVRLQPVGLATNFDLDHSRGGPFLNSTISGWNFQFEHQGITGKDGVNVPSLCGANIFGCTVPDNRYSQFMYVYNTPVMNSNGSKGRLLDPYLMMATSYGWANRMFQTNQGPSYPAHQYIFGATSAPSAEDDAQGVFASENAPGTAYGCGAERCCCPREAPSLPCIPLPFSAAQLQDRSCAQFNLHNRSPPRERLPSDGFIERVHLHLFLCTLRPARVR